MPEIRFKISEKLDDIIAEVANSLGVDKSDYVKMLILNDLIARDKQPDQKKQK